MKQQSLWLAGISILLSAFTACTNEVEDASPANSELREVRATVEDFVTDAESRTTFSVTSSGLKFYWADKDTLGIFPSSGAQAYFPILTNDESSSASFTGGGWALKSSSTYSAYYPFIGNFYLDKTKIPVSYTGQTQDGDASTDHLGAYDYLAASATAPESGKVSFSLKHLGAFVQLKLTSPQATGLTSVTLSADENVFITEGTIDITAETPSITATKKSSTLSLNLKNVATTEANQTMTLYLLLAPVDMSNSTLSAVVKHSDGTSETLTLQSKNFEAGKAYALSGTLKDASITSGNTVNVTTAGTMKSLLGSDYLNITSLKVTGSINGDDIYYLRKMLGSSDFSETGWGKLTTLDLSEATIVKGGDWYRYEDGDDYEYTSNNVIGDYMFYRCANLQNIVLPKNTTKIGKLAFYGCNALTSIIISDNVTSIGDAAFRGCAFTTVTIPNSVTSIGEEAFSGCDALTSIVIPNGVTSIGYRTFASCDVLTSIVIPDGVTSIKRGAFEFCVALTSVTIGNGVTSIGSSAFYDCDALISIVIPNNVVSIGYQAFAFCDALTSITIGSGVTSIGEGAFLSCSALGECYCYATTPPSLYKDTFYGIKSDAILYVPARYESAYKTLSWDKWFSKMIVMEE